MRQHFDTTRWTLLEQIKSSDELVAMDALDQVCKNYWVPIYAWLRGSGYPPEVSEDYTQGFLQYAMRTQVFQKADSSRGKLRNLLIRSLRNFIGKETKKRNALKRSGRLKRESLDYVSAEQAESVFAKEVYSPQADPSRVFDQRWGRALLQRALERLRIEYREKGKGDVYDVLNPLLSESNHGSRYEEASEKLGVSDGAARVAFYRLKNRFRDLFREEVAKTICEGDDLDEEIRYLIGVIER